MVVNFYGIGNIAAEINTSFKPKSKYNRWKYGGIFVAICNNLITTHGSDLDER